MVWILLNCGYFSAAVLDKFSLVDVSPWIVVGSTADHDPQRRRALIVEVRKAIAGTDEFNWMDENERRLGEKKLIRLR